MYNTTLGLRKILTLGLFHKLLKYIGPYRHVNLNFRIMSRQFIAFEALIFVMMLIRDRSIVFSFFGAYRWVIVRYE